MDNRLVWLGLWEGDTAIKSWCGIFQDTITGECTYDFDGSQTRRLI
jgi:hypothetical protein